MINLADTTVVCQQYPGCIQQGAMFIGFLSECINSDIYRAYCLSNRNCMFLGSQVRADGRAELFETLDEPNLGNIDYYEFRCEMRT